MGLRERIVDAQAEDSEVKRIRDDIDLGKCVHFVLRDGVLVQGDRLYVPESLRTEILEEAHLRPCAMHPESTKMYHDLRSCYVWKRMKRDVAEYLSRSLSCQQIKAEHRRPGPLPIPEWKWEHLTMDFVTGPVWSRL